jgi:hypothetical protein
VGEESGADLRLAGVEDFPKDPPYIDVAEVTPPPPERVKVEEAIDRAQNVYVLVAVLIIVGIAVNVLMYLHIGGVELVQAFAADAEFALVAVTVYLIAFEVRREDREKASGRKASTKQKDSG